MNRGLILSAIALMASVENSAVICTDAMATKEILIPKVLDYTVQMMRQAAEMAEEEITEDVMKKR